MDEYTGICTGCGLDLVARDRRCPLCAAIARAEYAEAKRDEWKARAEKAETQLVALAEAYIDITDMIKAEAAERSAEG